METTELRPGYTIPRLIKGGWQLAGGHGAVARDEAIADMAAYAERGSRRSIAPTSTPASRS